MSDAAPQEPLVTHLKRAGEQVLGAKPLTGNDHVRLSALLKVAALEIEALCAARDDAAELRAALREWAEATRAAEWFELDQTNAYGTDHADAEDRLQAAVKALRALAATEGRGEP